MTRMPLITTAVATVLFVGAPLGHGLATEQDPPAASSPLTDGTGFTEQTTLEAAAKNIRVVIQNGGHRPMAR